MFKLSRMVTWWLVSCYYLLCAVTANTLFKENLSRDYAKIIQIVL